jgi:hypothetical protein
MTSPVTPYYRRKQPLTPALKSWPTPAQPQLSARGSGGFYQRRRGILDHLEAGTITLLDSAVHDWLCLKANYQTGVTRASAEMIRALCPSGISLKSIQRALEKLERLGWIKRFRKQGAKGNYYIVIGKYFVRDLSLRWWSVNVEKTLDYRNVQYDLVSDPSLLRDQAVTDDGTDVGASVSPSLEVRTENEEENDDDDDDERGEKKSPRVSGQSSPSKTRTKELSPKQIAWAHGRILARGNDVEKPSAYIRTAMPGFLAEWDEQVQLYLMECAQRFIREARAKNPNKAVPHLGVFVFLAAEAQKADLPCDDDLFASAVRAASASLGLVEVPLAK